MGTFTTLAKREDPDEMPRKVAFHQGLQFLLRSNHSSGPKIYHYLDIATFDPLKCIKDNPIHISFIYMGKYIRIQRVRLHHHNFVCTRSEGSV